MLPSDVLLSPWGQGAALCPSNNDNKYNSIIVIIMINTIKHTNTNTNTNTNINTNTNTNTDIHTNTNTNTIITTFRLYAPLAHRSVIRLFTCFIVSCCFIVSWLFIVYCDCLCYLVDVFIMCVFFC